MNIPATTRAMAPARVKLLTAAFAVVREKGYVAATVDSELCARAGVAKGSFFHHFKDKEALGLAAAHHWSETTAALFASAPYHRHKDPLDRVLGYVDFRRALLDGPVAEFPPASSARWCRRSTRPTPPSATPATPASAATPRRSRPTSRRR